MKYSMKDIRSSISRKKRFEDSILAIIFHRPLSYPVTYLCVNMGVSAWTVSIFSVLVAIAGCVMIGFDSYLLRWIGIVLINTWAILDCVDGNVARVTKTQSDSGAFMDAESGYIMYACVYLALGMAAFYTSPFLIQFNKPLFILVGAIASISDLLARLIHQKYLSSVQKSSETGNVNSQSVFQRLRKRVSTEIGIAGFVIVGTILAQVLCAFDILVCFYGVFNLMMLIVTLTIYSKKARGKLRD